MNFIATIHGIYDDTKSQFAVSTATHPPGLYKPKTSFLALCHIFTQMFIVPFIHPKWQFEFYDMVKGQF
jgi:hypothetical protein